MSRRPSRLGELRRYPSAIAGLAIIAFLLILAGYTVITLPYPRAISLWRGGEGVWLDNPRNARPSWINLFPWNNYPRTVIVDSRTGPVEKVLREADGSTELHMELAFEFPFDAFAKEITVSLAGTYRELTPYVSLRWKTPDGREIRLADRSAGAEEVYRLSQDNRLMRRLHDQPAEIGLFSAPGPPQPAPLKGTYGLLVDGILFEPDSDVDARLVVYGQVHGIAGTDHRRRDLSIALLWGAPVALAFGFVAAVGTSITTMIIAAIGVWFGKWVDSLIQRITEVNLILPLLPILIMVGTFYSRSIWAMLGTVIVFSVFSAGIKTYRAMFLQVRESPYIEAARAYGAGGLRIVFLYMIPRVLPVLVPGFVVAIPTFVFLEATLAALGLGDPVLPTWGKLLDDARVNGALYNGHYYWMLQPAAMLMLTGLGFAMLGFALDRVFNPRLREL